MPLPPPARDHEVPRAGRGDRSGVAPASATRSVADPGTDRPGERPWTRRGLLRSALLAAASLSAPIVLRGSPARAKPPAATHASPETGSGGSPGQSLPESTRERLARSGFVYVSPLRSDGSESRCHGEVWFGWLDGDVVLITSRTSWKARAVSRGLDRARIWVGDHGRWDGWLGKNESFRRAPSFEARARVDSDAALLDRLMARYAEKYPDEFPGWEERMRSGFASGERILLRYTPTPVG